MTKVITTVNGRQRVRKRVFDLVLSNKNLIK